MIFVILVHGFTLYLPSASSFKNEMGEIEGIFKITILFIYDIVSVPELAQYI